MLEYEIRAKITSISSYLATLSEFTYGVLIIESNKEGIRLYNRRHESNKNCEEPEKIIVSSSPL